MNAPAYLLWEEAIRKYEIDENALRAAVERGLVRAIKVDGHIAVAEEDVRKLRSANGELVAELPQFIPLGEAVQRYGIPEETLKRAVESGTIRAVQLGEEVAVREGDVEKIVIRKKDFEHLRGTPINLLSASRKYGISHRTLRRWVQAGYIALLGREGRKVLVDEADVAYRVEIYRRLGGGRGRRIFDAEGKPYRVKHPERTRHPTPIVEVVE